MPARAPSPDTITGRRARAINARGLCERCVGRRDGEVGDASARAARTSVGGGGQGLHLVGEHEVGDTPLPERVLARQVHQLDVVGVALHGLGRDRHIGEGGGEVEILERAPAADLRRHLPRDGEHRRAVDLRVVQTGEQVRRSGSRDRETRGELAR